jgi:hypothetical protein
MKLGSLELVLTVIVHVVVKEIVSTFEGTIRIVEFVHVAAAVRILGALTFWGSTMNGRDRRVGYSTSPGCHGPGMTRVFATGRLPLRLMLIDHENDQRNSTTRTLVPVTIPPFVAGRNPCRRRRRRYWRSNWLLVLSDGIRRRHVRLCMLLLFRVLYMNHILARRVQIIIIRLVQWRT